MVVHPAPFKTGHSIVAVRKAGGLVVWVRFPVARKSQKKARDSPSSILGTPTEKIKKLLVRG